MDTRTELMTKLRCSRNFDSISIENYLVIGIWFIPTFADRICFSKSLSLERPSAPRLRTGEKLCSLISYITKVQ